MFSACGSTNPYGGRIKIRLFSKRKTQSTQSDEGIDLKKVKGKHCVETWASLFDQNTSANNHDSQNNHNRQEYHDNQKNKSKLPEAVQSECLVKLENCEKAQLVLSVELNKEKECKHEELENVSR